MTKNGLFLISIGLIMFMFCVNRVTYAYDLLLMVTAITFIVSGSLFAIKGSRKDKQLKKKEEGK